MSAAVPETAEPPHVPVLLDAILTLCAPVRGVWLDGTFGAGGHSRGLLDAGAERVIALDRDPHALKVAADWADAYGGRLKLVEGTFSDLDRHAKFGLDGVVLDLGVSSMQLDQAERGFSFQADGPLDMRMSGSGRSAADIVGGASEAVLADILFHYGEERSARAIARAIVNRRKEAPIETTRVLAQVIEAVLPRRTRGASHPATRTFQALRIAVNDEFTQLAAGLEAAERALRAGGWLAVVSFHSLEDRVVKRFFQERSGRGGRASRHQPEGPLREPRFVAPEQGGLSLCGRGGAQSARAIGKVAARSTHGSIGRSCRPVAAGTAKGNFPVKTLFHLVTATAVLALAVWAYRQNYETQARLKEVDGLHVEIAGLRGRASMLRAEWAYLNKPERLDDLANLNFDRLRLLELGPGNFLRIDQIPYPADPDLAASLEGGDE